MSNVIIVLAIVVYLAMMLYIGFIMSNKNKNTDDFYLGGRKLGPLVTAMSAEASDMSSWLLMGLPCHRHLSQLAARGAPHPRVHPHHQFHHDSGLLRGSLR